LHLCEWLLSHTPAEEFHLMKPCLQQNDQILWLPYSIRQIKKTIYIGVK